MKVYVEPPQKMGIGIFRVAKAFKDKSPVGYTFVDDRKDADVVIHHAIGVGNMDEKPIHERIAEDELAGRISCMMQYCLRSTELPTPTYWQPLWDRCAAVWSYYDLEEFTGAKMHNFYYAPLGVDDAFRKNEHTLKLFKIGTSGWVADTEGALEASMAIERWEDAYQFHLGPDLQLGRRVVYAHGLTDRQVSDRWNECVHVAGLRRVEGFELPAAEGLVCGAWPILFDRPHYRQWFNDLGAIFIKESTCDHVAAQLRQVFVNTALHESEVQDEHIALARARFNWTELLKNFWEFTSVNA